MRSTKLINIELTDDEMKHALVLAMRAQADVGHKKYKTYADHLEKTAGWSVEFEENNWVLTMDGSLPDE